MSAPAIERRGRRAINVRDRAYELAVELANYLAKRLDGLRPDEASAARVLSVLVKNQRLG